LHSNTDVGASVQQNLPTEHSQFDNEIFHWKTILRHNVINVSKSNVA